MAMAARLLEPKNLTEADIHARQASIPSTKTRSRRPSYLSAEDLPGTGDTSPNQVLYSGLPPILATADSPAPAGSPR